MEKNTKKSKNLDFVDSLANNEKYKSLSLEELEDQDKGEAHQQEDQNSNKPTADGNGGEENKDSVESKGPQKRERKQKGKKKLMDILAKKPAGPIKAIPIPLSIHSKISSLSSITDYGISDIASSVLLDFLETHKTEILKMQQETLNEWK